MPRLKVLSRVIDGAKERPPRPWAEFFVRSSWPIREMYLDRFIINIVWFTRNYLNIIMVSAILAAFIYPLFFVCLGCAGAVHYSRAKPSGLRLLKIAQFLACVLAVYSYGFFVPIVTALFPMLVIAFHAITCPYTDESFEHYEDMLRKCGEEPAQPRTPVQSFIAKSDTQFAKAAEESANVPPPLDLDPLVTPRIRNTGMGTRKHTMPPLQSVSGDTALLAQSLPDNALQTPGTGSTKLTRRLPAAQPTEVDT